MGGYISISLSVAKAQSEFRGQAKQAPLLVHNMVCINIHDMLLALLLILGRALEWVCH